MLEKCRSSPLGKMWKTIRIDYTKLQGCCRLPLPAGLLRVRSQVVIVLSPRPMKKDIGHYETRWHGNRKRPKSP